MRKFLAAFFGFLIGCSAAWGQQVTAVNPTPVQFPFPQGRLTLTSATPVLTTTVAAATAVIYTAYVGKNVPIYNGQSVQTYQICAANTAGACEISVTLGNNWATNSNYDWFAGLDSGTLRLCTGPAWTSDTGRGTGAGTTQLQQLDGLLTNQVSMTCRYNNTTTFTCAINQCTYLGSMRTGAAGQTNWIYGAVAASGTAGNFGLWNMYNRVNVNTFVGDTTDTWTYAVLTTWRAANGSATMRVSTITGMNEDSITATYYGTVLAGAATTAAAGIGINSTTAFTGSTGFTNNAVSLTPVVAIYSGLPGLGYNYYQAIEFNNTTTASTWVGDGAVAYDQTGLSVQLRQ